VSVGWNPIQQWNIPAAALSQASTLIYEDVYTVKTGRLRITCTCDK